MVFIGVDGEMTGTDPGMHSLIQIGVAVSELDVFTSRIGWEQFEFEQESLAAIGIRPDEIGTEPNAAAVDEALVMWLALRGIEPGTVVPIGWGVSNFDRPFIRKTLPGFHRFLHHHSIELNAVVYSLAGTRTYHSEYVDFACWKAMAKQMATLALLNERGVPPKPHDAADDALLALLAWKWLRAIIAHPGRDTAIPGECAWAPAEQSSIQQN